MSNVCPWGYDPLPRVQWYYWLEHTCKRLVNVHAPDDCYDDKVCPIHNPTEHPFRHWEQDFDITLRKMTRISPDDHTVWVDDPDDPSLSWNKM